MGLHILIVDRSFRTPDAPGHTRSYDIKQHLEQAGHRVSLLTQGTRWSAAREVKRIPDLDVALIVNPSSRVAVGAMAACRARETPFLLDERSNEGIGRGFKAPFVFRRNRRGAALVFAASPELRGWLAGMLRDTAPIVISPAGADSNLFQARRDVPDPYIAAHPRLTRGPLIVFAGTLSAARPFGRLLELAVAARQFAPEISFLVCGDGPVRLDLNAHAARLDVLERNLWFAPARPRAGLPGLLEAATVVLAFGTDANTPLSEPGAHLFDALAAARPVALIGGGWQRELIESRQAGVVLPEGDGPAMVQELVDFLRDKDLVRRAGEQAGALARGRYGSARILAEMRQALERAAAEHSRAATARRKILARKRNTDIAVSLVLLTLFSPLWLAAAIAVAISQRGWPFKLVERTGVKARTFRMLTFSGTNKLISRTGLDVVPALFNVLFGQMSLVGPAPHPVSYHHFYTADQQRRLDLRPGLTSHRGRTSASWEDRFIDDLWYVDHVSWWLDVKLMFQALGRAIAGRRHADDTGLAQFDEIMARSQGAEDV